MIKVMAVCDFSDLLEHAVSIGFNWNNAHDLLEKAKINIGRITTDNYSDNAYCEANEHVEAREILKSFMDKNNLQKFYITPKYYDA